MNLYDKALLDDGRNYTAMHYEFNKIYGNTTTSDPYHGFEVPIIPTYSLRRMLIPEGSRVKITNLDVVSVGKPIVEKDNTLAPNILKSNIMDYTMKIPKHILEY